ncbi:MAG: hypothetical protein RLT87_04685 [Gammaproteobacteria bacterium]
MTRKLALLFISLVLPAYAMAFNINAVGKAGNNSMFDSRSCNELYMQASALEKQTYQHQHNYYTDKQAQAASIASAVFTPAFYYFGYAAFKDYKSQVDATSAMQDIDAIRARMAEKRCFDQ